MFKLFRANLDEECGWMGDQLNLLDAIEEPSTLAAAQSLLNKHEAFKTNFNVHKERLHEVKNSGTELIEEVSCLFLVAGVFAKKKVTEFEFL